MTGTQIEIEVYNLIKSELDDFIAGKTYVSGTRPFNSDNEDAVITFITGLNNQIQSGVLNINIYVKNIDNGNTDLVKNINRCLEIEAFISKLIKSISKTDYFFTIGNIIQTFEEKEIKQHFINTRLKFRKLKIN